MRINSVRSALSYQVNQQVSTNQNRQQAALAKPQPAQDNGIIIVGGKPSQGEERGIIVVGGKDKSPAEDRGIIIVGGKTHNSVATQNGILFVGGLSVIR